MSYLRDRVIVLKKEPFREQDRRYVMYGREHGLLIAVARGSSVKNSKQAGHLEPFSESEVMVAKGSAFDKLAVARLIVPGFFGGEARLASFAVCGAFAELVVKLTRQGIPDPRIFDLLKELIQTMADLPMDPSPGRARLLYSAAALKLLDLLGFAPMVEDEDEQGRKRDEFVTRFLLFIRRSPLKEALRVTATVGILHAVSMFVEEAMKQTPLTEEPRGAYRIQALLD